MTATPCVAVAVSGGRDSTALLHATARAAQALGLQVLALHVHHGLQAEADAWVRHLKRQCARWARSGLPVRLKVARLDGRPATGESVEAWARRARYLELARMAREEGASLVLLAHHRRDQAETVLLQALRGGGARGLAAMPACREREGISWARPWLGASSQAIDAYVARHRLSHIDDASNRDTRLARNRLRQALWPALLDAFPGAEPALASVAAHAARSAELQQEVAAADLALLLDAEAALNVESWRRLSPARRWFALQGWLQAADPVGASDVLVQRLSLALETVEQGAWPLGAAHQVRLYRSRLSLSRGPAVPPPCAIDGAAVWATAPEAGPQWLAPWSGRVVWEAVSAGGLDAERLRGAQWRARSGQGHRFQRTVAGPARSLKKQFQDAGIPHWLRQVPLLWQGPQLLWVPGLGVDARVPVEAGATQWLPRWEALAADPGAST